MRLTFLIIYFVSVCLCADEISPVFFFSDIPFVEIFRKNQIYKSREFEPKDTDYERYALKGLVCFSESVDGMTITVTLDGLKRDYTIYPKNPPFRKLIDFNNVEYKRDIPINKSGSFPPGYERQSEEFLSKIFGLDDVQLQIDEKQKGSAIPFEILQCASGSQMERFAVRFKSLGVTKFFDYRNGRLIQIMTVRMEDSNPFATLIKISYPENANPYISFASGQGFCCSFYENQHLKSYSLEESGKFKTEYSWSIDGLPGKSSASGEKLNDSMTKPLEYGPQLWIRHMHTSITYMLCKAEYMGENKTTPHHAFILIDRNGEKYMADSYYSTEAELLMRHLSAQLFAGKKTSFPIVSGEYKGKPIGEKSEGVMQDKSGMSEILFLRNNMLFHLVSSDAKDTRELAYMIDSAWQFYLSVNKK